MKPGRGVAGAALLQASISHHSEEMHAHQAVPFPAVIAFLKQRKKQQQESPFPNGNARGCPVMLCFTDANCRLVSKFLQCVLRALDCLCGAPFHQCWAAGGCAYSSAGASWRGLGLCPKRTGLCLGRCCFHRNTSVYFSLGHPWYAYHFPTASEQHMDCMKVCCETPTSSE